MAHARSKGCALITGASSGIGRELARVFATNGHPVVLVARSEAKLVALADELKRAHGIEATVVTADLGQGGAAQALFADVEGRGIAVDVLVNNAGTMPVGAFAETETAALLDMVALNITSLTALTSLFLKPMITRGHGKVLNLASIASFQPLPSLAAYAASKAFVLSLSEALAEELRGTGVTVSALCPGLTKTGMVEGAQRDNAVLRNLPAAMMADPAAVAQEGYKACMEGQTVRVPGMALSMATGLIQAQRSVVRTVTGLFGRQAM